MYYVVNLCERAIVAESPSYGHATLLFVEAIEESDGFYTEDDFSIMNEAELEDYIKGE